MKTSNPGLLCEIDVLENVTKKEANDLEVVKELEKLIEQKEIAVLALKKIAWSGCVERHVSDLAFETLVKIGESER